MTRYSTIEEVDAALVQLEEHERTVLTDKASGEKHMEREKPASMSASRSSSLNGQALANGVEENGGAHEEGNGDYDSASQGSTMDPDGNDDEEELDDDACDTDDYAERDGQASDEDDEIHVRQKVMLVDPEEEADFDREFRALMQVSKLSLFDWNFCISRHTVTSYVPRTDSCGRNSRTHSSVLYMYVFLKLASCNYKGAKTILKIVE